MSCFSPKEQIKTHQLHNRIHGRGCSSSSSRRAAFLPQAPHMSEESMLQWMADWEEAVASVLPKN
eukprot:2170730-Amphidinium_carterae.1